MNDAAHHAAKKKLPFCFGFKVDFSQTFAPLTNTSTNQEWMCGMDVTSITTTTTTTADRLVICVSQHQVLFDKLADVKF